jgi:hypothetical protein
MMGRITGRPTTTDNGINKTSLPLVGSLKVGKLTEKGYPTSVDYFIPSGKYASLFTRAYGERPDTLQIVFTEDDPEKVCRELYEYRDDRGGLVAYGDGREFRVWDGRQQYVTLTTDDYPDLMASVERRYPVKKSHGWTVTLTVTFLVPLVRSVAGVWRFVSKGAASTIPTIRDTFDAVREQRGFVRGIIFDLSVRMAKSQKPGSASRFPVVQLVPNESEDNLRLIHEAMQPIRLIDKHLPEPEQLTTTTDNNNPSNTTQQ